MYRQTVGLEHLGLHPDSDKNAYWRGKVTLNGIGPFILTRDVSISNAIQVESPAWFEIVVVKSLLPEGVMNNLDRLEKASQEVRLGSWRYPLDPAGIAVDELVNAAPELIARVRRTEAQLGQRNAEIEMLRGVGCLDDGDGPCGCCIKCLRIRAEFAESQLDELTDRWRSEVNNRVAFQNANAAYAEQQSAMTNRIVEANNQVVALTRELKEARTVVKVADDTLKELEHSYGRSIWTTGAGASLKYLREAIDAAVPNRAQSEITDDVDRS